MRRAAASARVCVAVLSCVLLGGNAGAAQAAGVAIPSAQVLTLDGHALSLPRDLPARATVFIVGFGRHSQDATTAWEKPVRLQLAHVPAIGFYDLAMLASVPSFVRPLVLSRVRKAVPDVLKPNFIPLTDNEDAWKRASGYLPDQPEAAYVLLVDATGTVRWSTHASFTPAGFAQLTQEAQRLAAEKH